jgi:DNA-binding CsgD family transcriptional regulator
MVEESFIMAFEPKAANIQSVPFAGTAHADVLPGMSTRQLNFLVLIFLFCGSILAVDVAAEAIVAIRQPFATDVFSHIAIEVFATVLLAIGAWLVISQLSIVKKSATQEHVKLVRLQGAFDELLHVKFHEWHLSSAEIDVALLSIRGLSISAIAESRKTRIGTVKAQLNTIFRKVGVNSRTELLALCMDELLDYGSQNFRPTTVAAR